MSESYTTGGDTLFKFDDPDYAGQTFRPIEDHILEYIDLNLRGPLIKPEPVILVFRADPYHKPTGDYVSRSRTITEKHSGLFTTGRVRFSMTPVELTAFDYYCIVAKNFPHVGGTSAYWLYDKANATYPRGMRISTNDRGLTWTVHYNDDHIFAEFGNPPLPIYEPPPPILNWAQLDIEITYCQPTVTIRVPTNVPCHLFCYHTAVPPQTNPIARTRRGLPLQDDTYFCLVAHTGVEQEEPGDTLRHTFRIPNWPPLQNRWFTFKGNVDFIPVPSIGPIFQYKPVTSTVFRNSSFELWPATPKFPLYWEPYIAGEGIRTWQRSALYVQDGKYSVRLTAKGTDLRTGLRQFICPYHYQGKNIKYTFNYYAPIGCYGRIHIIHFGPPTWSWGIYFNARAGWHYDTVTHAVDPNCTGIEIGFATHGTPAYPGDLYWDNFGMTPVP